MVNKESFISPIKSSTLSQSVFLIAGFFFPYPSLHSLSMPFDHIAIFSLSVVTFISLDIAFGGF